MLWDLIASLQVIVWFLTRKEVPSMACNDGLVATYLKSPYRFEPDLAQMLALCVYKKRLSSLN